MVEERLGMTLMPARISTSSMVTSLLQKLSARAEFCSLMAVEHAKSPELSASLPRPFCR